MRLPVEIRCLLSVSGLAFASLVHVSVAFGTPSLPKVTVESGELEGTYFGSENEVAFLGVPYATPPVGEHRNP
jgi:carboxylesterase family protein